MTKVKAMEVEGCSYQEIEDALKDEIGFDFGEEMKAVAKEVEGEFKDDDDRRTDEVRGAEGQEARVL